MAASDRDARLGALLLVEASMYGRAQAADAFAHQVGWDVREVQAHRVRPAVIRVEPLAGHERDLVLDGLEQELTRVDVGWQLGPHEQAAGWTGVVRVAREVL